MPGIELANFCEAAHDRNVRQSMPCILSFQDLRLGLVQGDHKVNVTFGAIGWRIDIDVCVDDSVLESGIRDPYRDFGLRRNFGKNLLRLFRIVGDELFAAIHNELWRVDALEVEDSPIPFLSLSVGVGRIRVSPAVMVPVIHVFTERDDLHIWERLSIQLLQ